MQSKNKNSDEIHYTFETERLIIRPLEEQDRDFYALLYVDKNIMQHISKPLTISSAYRAFDNTWKAMRKSISSRMCLMTWVLVLKENNLKVGITSLRFNDNKIVDSGVIINTEYIRKGYGRECLSKCVQIVSLLTNNLMKAIRSSTSLKNINCINLYLSLGFRVISINNEKIVSFELKVS